ncbi:MAG: hypothetical protein ACOCQN_00635 [Halanaerobiaceae bacterium]
MEYMVDVWGPDTENPFRNLINKDYRKNYKHYLYVKVRAENEERAIEKAIDAAYRELPAQEKGEVDRADLMYKDIKLFSEWEGVK